MFDLFDQQGVADRLKSTAFQGSPEHREAVMESIKRIENARVWHADVFGQAIDQVAPGSIWTDANERVHIEGGPATLAAIVDTYMELTGQTEVPTGGLYTTAKAADYIVSKLGDQITRRAVIWYIRDKAGREKAAREGVLQGDMFGHTRIFTQAQLDHFIERYPEISRNGWDTRRERSKM